jgi:hypothetical protein
MQWNTEHVYKHTNNNYAVMLFNIFRPISKFIIITLTCYVICGVILQPSKYDSKLGGETLCYVKETWGAWFCHPVNIFLNLPLNTDISVRFSLHVVLTILYQYHDVTATYQMRYKTTTRTNNKSCITWNISDNEHLQEENLHHKFLNTHPNVFNVVL